MQIDYTTQKRIKALFESIKHKKGESYSGLEINRDFSLTFEKVDGRLNLVLSIKDPQNYYEDFTTFESQIYGKNKNIDSMIETLEQITNNELNFYCEPYGENEDKHYWISNTLKY